MTEEQPEHLTTTEARAGSASKVNRIVLFSSLFLVVVPACESDFETLLSRLN